MKNHRQLVLASASPRRSALLEQLGLGFEQIPPQVDESVRPGETAIDYVERLSEVKADEVMQRELHRDPIILSADTVVVVEGNILGKPESKRHGTGMLLSLSAREHQVLTGVTLKDRNAMRKFHVSTYVTFRQISERECEDYWNTGEPRDKAGGYGIQGLGAIFVAAINGSYSNVVGLPLTEVAAALRDFGIDCLEVRPEKEFEVVQDSRHG